mgnify:CR=1 FL=1
MTETYIYLAILLTAFATYLPRFLGVFSSDFVNEEGKLFKFVSKPYILKNSSNSVMFHFLMVSNNESAVKVANEIVTKYNKAS